MRADQSISFQAMQGKLKQLVDIIRHDPAVATVVGFTGGARAGGGFMFVTLKPRAERKEDSAAVITRLRPQACAGDWRVAVPQPGAGRADRRTAVELHVSIHVAKRRSRCPARLGDAPGRADETGSRCSPMSTPTSRITASNRSSRIDRASAARFGISSRDIDNALYDAFGQRQVSTLYTSLNQYHVVMEVAPQLCSIACGAERRLCSCARAPALPQAQRRYAHCPAVARSNDRRGRQYHRRLHGAARRLRAFRRRLGAHLHPSSERLARDHDLVQPRGRPLAERCAASPSSRTSPTSACPTSVHGSFQGTARTFQESVAR